jgi:hypothetical protein
MKKRLALPIAVLALFGLMTAFASTAQAFPTRTTPCSGCHSGPNVPVAATLVSVTPSLAIYNVSAPTASAIAVFDGATKLATFTATSGQFSVAPGKTYSIFAVTGPTTSDGLGQTSISPVAPVADKTAPTTVSNAKATYVSTAAIKLTATDNVGGSGVAATYYRLDGAAQVSGTSINVTTVGAHTLEFWSVDVAGNSELHKTAAFTITAPVPDTTAPTTTSNAVANYYNSATVRLTATDNAGGSGVAATYYRLDGGAQVTGTSISVTTVGSHTIEFWSADVAGNIETPHKTASFEVTIPSTPPTPVYRFYNKRSGSHFYTASVVERDTLIAKLSAAYSLDGVAFTVNTLNPDNNTPLYRFYNRENGSHFYTASESEKANIIAAMSDDYVYDGPAYNVSTTKVAGAATVYRFYNKSNGSHFYTASESEKANVVANLSATYSLDGVAYYLAP